MNVRDLAILVARATADFAAKSDTLTELLRLEKIVVRNLCLDYCGSKLPISIPNMAEKKRKGKHVFGISS